MDLAEGTRTPGGENDIDAGGLPVAEVDWVRLVEGIRNENPGAMEELYRVFSRGIRYYLCRHLGPEELDDRVHDSFLVVVQAIRRDELREAGRLMGFVRTVVHRQVAASIEKAVQARRDQTPIDPGEGITDLRRNPEESAIAQQQEEIMTRILRGISRRDREILTRFYLLDQTQEQICAEMQLSETQFRLLKSRAKTRFGELGKRSLAKRSAATNFLRKIRGTAH
jgi:RNA polymerase sigma factor (sigma-70 family)